MRTTCYDHLLLQFLLPFLWNDTGLLAFCITSTKNHYAEQKEKYIWFLRNRLFTKNSMTIKMCAFSVHELFAFRVENHERFWRERIGCNNNTKNFHVKLSDIRDSQKADKCVIVAKCPSYKSHLGIQWDAFSTREERLQVPQEYNSFWSLVHHTATMGIYVEFERLSQILIDVQQLRGLAFITASMRIQQQHTTSLFLQRPLCLKLVLNRQIEKRASLPQPTTTAIKYTNPKRKCQFV